MSKDLVTKKDADELQEQINKMEVLLYELRIQAKTIKSFTLRKIVQGFMFPVAAIIAYARLKDKQ